MIRSMTGYGKAEQVYSGMTLKIEIRSLNGKQFDTYLRLQPLLKPFEIEIRNILKQNLHRGSLDVHIQISQNGSSRPIEINTSLAKDYYKTINTLATELKLPQHNIISALLNLPEVVTPSTERLSDEGWDNLKKVLKIAIENLDDHRRNEGNTLEKDLLSHISNIEKYQEEVKVIEPKRKDKIRERLEKALQEGISKDKVDQNRLEQELVYYIDKFDISEEQVRLANHCRYFKEVLEEESLTKGKKLNFILQEIGREINTTGAKANDAGLQRCVVKMKDELDKAKEQIMNVL